jgi:hypothetical protein
MITENLSTLKIHKLTKEQYERELAAGRIDESALYLTPDESATKTDIASVYKYKGTCRNFEEFILYNLEELVSAKIGYVWNITESCILPANFSMTGEDIEIKAGDKIAVVTEHIDDTPEGTIKFDILAGAVDLSDYASKAYAENLISWINF